MKLLMKKPGGELVFAETDEKYLMDCARNFFEKNTNMQRIAMQGTDIVMIIDEDGLNKQLPFNFFMEFSSRYEPIQDIVGTALFIRTLPANPLEEDIWDYEVTDVTAEDVKYVAKLLSPEYQYKLIQILREIYHL